MAYLRRLPGARQRRRPMIEGWDDIDCITRDEEIERVLEEELG